MVAAVLFLTQSGTPGDCVLTGLCNVVAEAPPAVAPGVMFLAAGLVLAGVLGWRRARRPGQEPATPAS